MRDLLPQLRGGKITRGVIGVSVQDVPLSALAEFGLKERRGALVGSVNSGGPAAKAGIEPGDVIIEFNGKPVQRRDQLVSMVVATKPGTRRAGQGAARQAGDVADRHGRRARISTTKPAAPRGAMTGRSGRRGERPVSAWTLGALTSDMARRLRVPPEPKACW